MGDCSIRQIERRRVSGKLDYIATEKTVDKDSYSEEKSWRIFEGIPPLQKLLKMTIVSISDFDLIMQEHLQIPIKRLIFVTATAEKTLKFNE